MAEVEVTGLTAARMLQIEAASIVDGDVDGGGHLILKKHDNSTIDAGSVIGPTGPTGAGTPFATPSTPVGRDASGNTAVVKLKAGGSTGTVEGQYVGSTASGSPTSGTFAVGDYVVSKDGRIYTCIAAGTPGRWATQPLLTDGILRIAELTPNFQHYPEVVNSIKFVFPNVFYYKDEAGIVRLGGLLWTKVASPPSTVMFTLPPTFRPARTLRFAVSHSAGIQNIIIRPNGDVVYAGDISNVATGASLAVTAYVSFSGVKFPAEDVHNPPVWTSLTSQLTSGWTAVGTVGTDVYAPPRGWVDSVGDLHLQGTLKNTFGGSSNVFTALPSALYTPNPTALTEMYVGASSHPGGYVRIDMDMVSSGLFVSTYNGTGDSSAISFDGITLASALKPLLWKVGTPFANSWALYGAGYGSMEVYRNDIGRVYWRGLVQGGGLNLTMGPVFEGADWFGPKMREIFPAIAYFGCARLDLVPASNAFSGAINAQQYFDTGGNQFVNLNSINYDARIR